MRTKLKLQKNSWIFQFLDVRVQWKFHVFKKSRGKGVLAHLSVHIQSGNCISHLLQKFEMNPITCERVTNKKVMIFSWKIHINFEKCIKNLVKYMFFRKSRWQLFRRREELSARHPSKIFHAKRSEHATVTTLYVNACTDTQTDTQTDTHRQTHRQTHTHRQIS